jgi:hypothetical protein
LRDELQLPNRHGDARLLSALHLYAVWWGEVNTLDFSHRS